MDIKTSHIFRWALILTLIGIVIPGTAPANEKDAVSPELALPLFLKIITYDQNFSKDSVHAITVFLVYDEAVTLSYEQMKESRDFFFSKKSLSVGEVPVDFVFISSTALEDSLKKVKDHHYYVVVFTNIKQQELQEGISICKTNRIASFAFDPSLLDKGVSVGIIIFEGKARILIDIESALSEGTQYSAHLFKVSKLHDNED